MRKRQRHQIIIYTLLGIAIYIIVMQMVKTTGDIGGDWDTISSTFIGSLPHLFGIALGFVLLIKNQSRYGTMYSSILPSGITGIFFAGLFYYLNTNNIWIDEIVTASFTITDLQTVVVLFWLLIGILVGLIRR